MNKKIITMAIAVNAMAAHAQSSVTLYGRIDNGFRFETGFPGGHRFNAESGDWGCSWLGLQGAEDLGGGTHAIFQLESLMNTQTGALWGSLFGRHATVGMMNPKMGALKLGNLGPASYRKTACGSIRNSCSDMLFQRWCVAATGQAPSMDSNTRLQISWG